MYTLEVLQTKTLKDLKEIGQQLNVLPDDRRRRKSWIEAIVGINPPLLQLLATSSAAVEQVQEPIAPAAKNPPGVEVEQAQEAPLESKFGRIVYPRRVQGAISQVAKTSPGVKTEATVSGSESAPAAKISLDAESDPNPILTGMPLSDKFLARYSPPQSEIIQFKSDADGQLSLIDFEVQSLPEPPDPDDFESLDAFREVLARWDAENAEMLMASMDSMCEWAPCPDAWYEPEPESLQRKASSMIELSPPAIECSITSATFTIPTFDNWYDRANRQSDTDEPPDTGIFARLPGPRPPKFPPQSASQPQVRLSQAKSAQLSEPSQNYPETIPKLFHSGVAGSSTQPARSPPGGDAQSR